MADLFSTRSAGIEAEKDRLIGSYIDRHGHRPGTDTILKLRQQATKTTRPEKTVHSLADLTKRWREQAASVIGEEPATWTARLLSHAETTTQALLRADDITQEWIGHLAGEVIIAVSEKRATWRHWNLHAEATRQTMGWRFASTADREAITAQIVTAAEQASMRLTPAELAAPAVFTRPDGTSRFRPANSAVYTSQAMLEAEDRLLILVQDDSGPSVPTITDIHQNHSKTIYPTCTTAEDLPGPVLSPDQSEAVWRIATSGLKLDLLIGPAGSGKTTTLAALRAVWETTHGSDSVVGLAPSATAAQVLGEDLGIPTENTAKWLTDHDTKGLGFKPGQLVIIDEASLAGTFTLDRITSLATEMGAKVLLVGDWAQLQAVEAGGAFTLLVASRGDAPQLVDIHRFHSDWEKQASLRLREGDLTVISTYIDHDRIKEGDGNAMQQQAYQAWLDDAVQGRNSILIADDRCTVTTLNAQARNDRIAIRSVAPDHEIALNDGNRASAGDMIITRRNDRRLQAGTTGWVRNGDRWTITHVHDDGSITVRRDGHHQGASVVLPAGYAAEHVDLGYAITAYRAQGVTVDTTHVVVTRQTPRENFYVAMTRGRRANTAYVATDTPEDDTDKLGQETITAARVLVEVLRNRSTEPSAHEAANNENDHWQSLAQLIPECQQIIADAKAIHDALPHEQRIAELKQFVSGKTTVRPSRTIAGLWPLPAFAIQPEHQEALNERITLIEQRITKLAQTALNEHPTWLKELGPYPDEQTSQTRWQQALQTLVAYRDRWGITGMTLGPPDNLDQRRDAAYMRNALARSHAEPASDDQLSTLPRHDRVISL